MIGAEEARLDSANIRAALDTEKPALGAPELAAVELEHGPGGIYEDEKGQDEEDNTNDEYRVGWCMDDDRWLI